MTHGSLFSGIGGFDLAVEWMGWENTFHCEWNEFGQRILKHYWPNAIGYGDITATDFRPHRGKVDIITGGFPCQPYSSAGKRLGKEDDRHLWPEMLRAVREVRPKWVVGENVLGIVNWNGGLVFEEVQADLEAEGYEVQPYVLPAVSVNAPHRRDRVWFVAYANGPIEEYGQGKDPKEKGEVWRNEKGDVLGELSGFRDASYADGELSQRGSGENKSQKTERYFGASFCGDTWKDFPTEPPVRRRDDGLSKKLDSITFSKWRNESIKAYGNAIVPQAVYQIFKAIEKYENQTPL